MPCRWSPSTPCPSACRWTPSAPPARARAEGVLGRVTFAQRSPGSASPAGSRCSASSSSTPTWPPRVARALRLGEYRISPREDGYWADDRPRRPGRHPGARTGARPIASSTWRGPTRPGASPPWPAGSWSSSSSTHQDDGQGGTVAEISLTGHLSMDTPLAGFLAQMVGIVARPAVERAVERKVRRFFRTVARVSRWAHDQPELLWSALERHPEVPATPDLADFRQILLAGRPPAWTEEASAYSLFPAAALPADTPAPADDPAPPDALPATDGPRAPGGSPTVPAP